MAEESASTMAPLRYPPSSHLLKRFTVVTGKGGVGKSTFAAALGLLSARQGHRTLLIELNTDGQVARLLGHTPSDGELIHLEDNIWTVNIRPTLALQEYGLMKLKFRTFYRLVFENPLVRSLVEFIPGLNDLVMLGKAFNHERELDEAGMPVWDRIIVDAPATGHGLTFFKLPKIIRDVVPSGNMHRETDEMWSLLKDRDRTQIHLVCLPEELPTQETVELFEELTETLDLPVGSIIMNRCSSSPFPDPIGHVFESMPMPSDDPQLKTQWRLGQTALLRAKTCHRHTLTLGALNRPVLQLPEQFANKFGRTDIETLADALGPETFYP